MDSSFLIASVRRRGPQAVKDRARELLDSGEAAINDIVRLEVLLGYKSRDELNRMRAELSVFNSCEITRRTWNEAANLGFRLRRAGLVVGLPDLLVATSAIEHSAPLVHIDAGFDRIAEHSELQVESYVSAV